VDIPAGTVTHPHGETLFGLHYPELPPKAVCLIPLSIGSKGTGSSSRSGVFIYFSPHKGGQHGSWIMLYATHLFGRAAGETAPRIKEFAALDDAPSHSPVLRM
jgi:hypothetical protein